jgi:hypothetical protein
VSLNQLIFVWIGLLLSVLIIMGLLLVCFCICFVCPCVICCCAYAIYHERDVNDLMDRYFHSVSEYVIQESEPQMTNTIVHPFKLRSPFSASKGYKSPKHLAKIIKKRLPEVRHFNLDYASL